MLKSLSSLITAENAPVLSRFVYYHKSKLHISDTYNDCFVTFCAVPRADTDEVDD